MTDWPKLTALRHASVSEWMTVVSKDVQFSPGARIETYYAIEQPSYLATVAMTQEGRILLVRQYRPAIERYSLELPGGLLDQDEDPATGIARELLEETGFTTAAIAQIAKRPHARAVSITTVFVFHCGRTTRLRFCRGSRHFRKLGNAARASQIDTFWRILRADAPGCPCAGGR